MTQVTFVTADGERRDIDAQDGDSVMQVALSNGVDEIEAECGGSMMCATCHVYIDDDRIPARTEDEEDMLEAAASEMKDSSRLSCQVQISSELKGLIIGLPETQI